MRWPTTASRSRVRPGPVTFKNTGEHVPVKSFRVERIQVEHIIIRSNRIKRALCWAFCIMLRFLRRASAGAAAGASAYAAYEYKTNEGFRRACQLYLRIGPVVFVYRAVEFKHALLQPPEDVAEQEWRALDRRFAVPVVKTLEELQGMYTKYGQIAAGMTNTLSPIWIEQLRHLEDAVPPRSVEVVYRTIVEETGRPVEATFSTFDPVPLGSASIGQVHRATLASDGSEVAVKVQYPDSKTFFRSDMSTIKSFFKLAAPEQLITLGELERQFEFEFDYRHEAANLAEVGANMTKHGFQPGEVVVPSPRVELCSERLLVMELTPGCKLLDGLRRYGAKLAAEQGQTIEEFELAMRRKIEREGVPARYEGPSATQIERYLRLARWRDTLVNSLIVSFNLVLGWAFGRLERRQTLLPPNAPRMMDILMRVHGTQLLVDGVFNADTHAGNFLLMPDDRIALIDYGSTKRLKRAERLSACCMYAALARRDMDTLYNLAVAGGYKSKHMNKEVIVKLLRFGNDTFGTNCRGQHASAHYGAHRPFPTGNDTFGRDLLGDKNVAQFMDELKAQDPYEQAADNLVMAAFMSFRLRIVGLALNHPVVCSDWWGRIAEKELEREGVPYRMWTLDFMRELNSATINLATVN